MNRKDIELLTEAYVKEGGENIPEGELGALAQIGIEELGEPPAPPAPKRLIATNIFDIISAMNISSVSERLGFLEMVDFHALADGMVATFAHKDGNTYKVTIKRAK